MSRIVLASASPRRKELLEQVGLEFEICPAKGEEVITAGSVDGAVLELSRQKAEEVAAGILSYNPSGAGYAAGHSGDRGRYGGCL